MYNTDTKSLLRQREKTLKRKVLRYNEYYQVQATFDNLYKQSKEGSNFKHLFQLISSDENILLAYRTIKRNHGSKTAGTNRHTIKTWENKNTKFFLQYIKERLNYYIPQSVRRVEILKPNGKTRPLGIPCIEDRLIQQAIKQVLEPICEAKFFPHSYGFRPNRSTEHALAYAIKKVNIDKCYYVIDMDIKGFFDNVNHAKLLKQLWTIGVQDKKVISIISAMLKAEIKGIGIPTKGTPQGGILSPLLANVVLNELDWWITSQWQNFPSNHQYGMPTDRYRQMRKTTTMKEIYLVRYADDFKIFCRKKEDAIKIFHATKQWLKERLSLEISEEKSHIVDIRKKPSEFLGFNLKAYKKNKKWIIKSHMTEKAMKVAKESIKTQIKAIKHNRKKYEVGKLNALISGLHNYYGIATEIVKDFNEINYNLMRTKEIQLRNLKTKQGYKSAEYKTKYKSYKGKTTYVCHVAIYPIGHIQTRNPRLFSQEICNYTKEGREKIHTKLKGLDKEIMNYMLQTPILDNLEVNDNRISLYTAQKGKCAITQKPLKEDLEVHHIIPKVKGGTDEYKNLILISSDVHKLIHATKPCTIAFYIQLTDLSKKAFNKLNRYRNYVGNERIKCE